MRWYWWFLIYIVTSSLLVYTLNMWFLIPAGISMIVLAVKFINRFFDFNKPF